MLWLFYGLVGGGVVVGGVALGLNAQGRLLAGDGWLVLWILVAALVVAASMSPFAVRHGRAKKG